MSTNYMSKEDYNRKKVVHVIDKLLFLYAIQKRIVETKTGELFVTFSNRKLQNGHRVYNTYPVNEEFRSYVQETVLNEYKAAI